MNIGIWGASVTYGKGDEEALGWVGRLRKALPAPEIDVYNFGICGNTTIDLLARFDSEVQAIHPDIVIISIGMNDSKYTGGTKDSLVPLEQYRVNIIELMRRAKTYTNNIGIVGLTNVDGPLITPKRSEFRDDLIITYNAVLEECANAVAVPYVSVFGLLDSATDISLDHLHPNANGYNKVYAKVASELRIAGILP